MTLTVDVNWQKLLTTVTIKRTVFFFKLGLHFSAALPPGWKPCWIFVQETGITGQYSDDWNVYTLTDCKSECAYMGWCLAFSFFSSSSQCRLHNNLEIVSDAQSEYYVKNCSATSGKKCDSLHMNFFLLFSICTVLTKCEFGNS